ncbi:hypothetical protein [Haloarchaeobius iranensis]|uniref:Lipoprotein n=1 Tax=Haloarchaeobius iranensis TaxID=996166 RepID=A0A1G9XQN6_9EURY|nr:hypothetical protein [Haloarchaeobius iranensis]SDM98821.1 hypothetical protein SAMN05192554_11178 [Haloarchaeobius iranensis]
MRRRTLLAATATALGTVTVAGCLGDDSNDGDGTTSPVPTTQSMSGRTDTVTTTGADSFPENCPDEPDIDGLPARPENPTESTVVDYVREFEAAYVVATDENYAAIDSITVTGTTAGDDGYEVEMAVEGVEATRTGTATQQPDDATSHRVTYRLRGQTLVRELRGYAAGRAISEDCWTVSTA